MREEDSFVIGVHCEDCLGYFSGDTIVEDMNEAEVFPKSRVATAIATANFHMQDQGHVVTCIVPIQVYLS